MLDNWNNHEFSRSQGLAKNFGATSGHAFVKSVCPDALVRAFLKSQQHRMLGIRYEKNQTTRFNSCYVIITNPSASGSSAEAGVPDRRQQGWGSPTIPIFYIVWGLLCCKMWHWQKLYYRSMRQRLQFYRLLFVCDLTPITASCPIFCLSDSFWTVALSYVSSFQHSVSSLVSNCAESWNNYDAAESFFQLQKGIEGLKGNEIPPRETVLICLCHTLVVWIGKSQTENTYFWTHVPK